MLQLPLLPVPTHPMCADRENILWYFVGPQFLLQSTFDTVLQMP